MNIPLFTYTPETDDTEYKKAYGQWHKYVTSNFANNEYHTYVYLFIDAFEYNISKITKPLTAHEFRLWLNIVENSNSYFQMINPDLKERVGFNLGKLLRRIFDLSDKTCSDNLTNVGKLLDKSTNKYDIVKFFSVYPNDYSIFDEMDLSLEASSLLSTFLTLDYKTNPNEREDFDYFTRLIYSPLFVEQFENFSTAKFLNRTDTLIPDLNNLMDTTFKTNKQQIDFIISTLFIAEHNISIKPRADTLMIKNHILSLFENDFPEQYTQYQTLKSLELELSPTALSNQLTMFLQIQPVELPTLG